MIEVGIHKWFKLLARKTRYSQTNNFGIGINRTQVSRRVNSPNLARANNGYAVTESFHLGKIMRGEKNRYWGIAPRQALDQISHTRCSQWIQRSRGFVRSEERRVGKEWRY